MPKCQCNAHKAERLSRLGMILGLIGVAVSLTALLLAFREGR